MSKFKIRMDKKRCITCNACLVHCKEKNDVPEGLSLNKLEIDGLKNKEGKPQMNVKYRPCMHCKKALCVEACPTGALYKREQDGLVLLREELCDGCKECIQACPWQVPQYNEATGRIMKCDMCLDRIEQGLDPSCVVGCTAKALSFQRPE